MVAKPEINECLVVRSKKCKWPRAAKYAQHICAACACPYYCRYKIRKVGIGNGKVNNSAGWRYKHPVYIVHYAIAKINIRNVNTRTIYKYFAVWQGVFPFCNKK